MKLQKFQEVCKKSQMKIVHREAHDGLVIIIADGLKPKSEKELETVHRTAYAVGPSEDHLMIAQTIDFDKALIENMRVENRVQHTLKKARETASSLVQARDRSVEEGRRSVH